MKAISIIVIGLLLGLLIFICIDCSSGTQQQFNCKVINHIYIPPRTEIWTTTDGEGNVSIHTSYYPEEFHLFCGIVGDDPATTFDCEESKDTYVSIKDDSEVIVSARIGKWTHKPYNPFIVK